MGILRGQRNVCAVQEDTDVTSFWSTVLVPVLVVLLALLLPLRVVREYERGVIFRLGRIRPLSQPGLRRVMPGIDRLIRVDLRVVTLTIPPQEVITRDNVPARVNAVVLFRVVDPVKSVMEVENFAVATSQIAQTKLRSLLGRVDLDTLLAHRDDLNADLRKTIADETIPGESRCGSWKSKTSKYPSPCNGRWPEKLKLNANGAPR